ncbi:hypothetical protein SEA_PUPPER_45 [Gordonia phage Pupper]|uniref:Helix-turn-helix DNA binding domain protein n=1 Tax=Gordonia phage Pupper TaxID=2571249 RepID=A0A4Y6EM98_9CAUD|nr:DNA binding protein [Gordonia phage Pupper]QDF18531.1 hypothetical protein SEA_PUPPER_45 [Gordonia phage Pupper]QDF18764.1 hypothetical protein SEA_SCENTAE_45 [Gordonia phage SCentae]
MDDHAERAARVVELTRQGMSGVAIADQLGIAERSVRRIRRRAGVSLPTSPPTPPETLSRALEMLQDGCPYAEVSRTLGVPVCTLRRRIPGYGMRKGFDWANEIRTKEGAF